MIDTNTLLAVSIPSLTVLIGILVNNHRIGDVYKRLDALDSSLNNRIGDTKEVLRAEIKAFRVEMLAEFRALNEKIDSSMRQHIAEYHK